MTPIHIYCMPGMAASPKIFEYLKFPMNFQIHLLSWIPPIKDEPLSDYAKRMCKRIVHKNPILLGVSFGGILVQEMAKYVSAKNKKKIIVIAFSSLTTDLCKKYKSNIILRGLRAVSDFEYEFQLAGMNRKLNQNIETIFLMSDVENQIISSRFVKEIVKLNGDIKKFTTKSTIKSLKEKYE